MMQNDLTLLYNALLVFVQYSEQKISLICAEADEAGGDAYFCTGVMMTTASSWGMPNTSFTWVSLPA